MAYVHPLIQQLAPVPGSLLPERKVADDLTPFFAVAALMVTLGALGLSVVWPSQSLGAGLVSLGLEGWYATYIGALVVLGPPMLLAFAVQWVWSREVWEPAMSLFILVLAGGLWLFVLIELATLGFVNPGLAPLVPAGVWAKFALMTLGWFAWLLVRGLLIRLRPQPLTLQVWRWGWHLALLPVVYHVGLVSALMFFTWIGHDLQAWAYLAAAGVSLTFACAHARALGTI